MFNLFNTPQARGIFGLSQGLLNASGPSRLPVGFGQALAQGMQGMQQAGDDFQDRQFRELMMRVQMAKATNPEWGETKDAFGNPIAYNKNDPSRTMAIGSNQVSKKPVSEYQEFMQNQHTQKNLDSQTERYSKMLESTGLSDLVGAAERANNVIAGKDDIAGYGEMVGGLPDWAVSQEGKDTRQAISELKNAILKARSGGAVTPTEADRFMRELGEGFGRGDSNLKQGIANLTMMLQEKIKNSTAGFSPDAVAQYLDRGGNVDRDRLAKYLLSTNTPQSTQKVSTQQQYDALPSGALYMEDDGKTYRKP